MQTSGANMFSAILSGANIVGIVCSFFGGVCSSCCCSNFIGGNIIFGGSCYVINLNTVSYFAFVFAFVGIWENISQINISDLHYIAQQCTPRLIKHTRML